MAAFYVIKWFEWSEKPQHTADWKILHDSTQNDASETKLYSIQKNYQVIDPALDMVMNEPGGLTFTVPPTHTYYSNLKSAGIRICVTVFRDGSFLWGGHPLTIDEDLYGSLTYSCEGVLGQLPNVIAPTFNRSGITIWGMFVSIFSSPYSYGTRCTSDSTVESCYRRFSEDGV